MGNGKKFSIAEAVGKFIGVATVVLLAVLLASVAIFCIGAVWHAIFKFFL